MSIKSPRALEKHLLDSIMPYSTIQQKQFPKSRHFYQPDKFIWNNPHRTSQSMYKFYHKYNDNYMKHKAPQIQMLEAMDREKQEKERIHKLRKLRQSTRHRFYAQQQNRMKLENKSMVQSIKAQVGTQSDRQTTLNSNSNQNHYSDRNLKEENKYDQKLRYITELIHQQVHNKHEKIRLKFHQQQKNNQILYDSIRKPMTLKTHLQIRYFNQKTQPSGSINKFCMGDTLSKQSLSSAKKQQTDCLQKQHSQCIRKIKYNTQKKQLNPKALQSL